MNFCGTLKAYYPMGVSTRLHELVSGQKRQGMTAWWYNIGIHPDMFVIPDATYYTVGGEAIRKSEKRGTDGFISERRSTHSGNREPSDGSQRS